MSTTTTSLLLLACSLLCVHAHGDLIPTEWTPEIVSSKQCDFTFKKLELSEALATLAEVIESNDIAFSLPKSCKEIKESSPVTPSGYYTISNGSMGSVVDYCNMDELYSCPMISLEQTLKGFSNILSANSAYERTSTSCQELRDKCSECTSGYYKILAEDLTEKYVYCSFEEKCGTAGPWTRVAYLNMSDCSSACPNGSQQFVNGSTIACGIQEPSDPGCVSISAPTAHSYSHICGQVAGYQKGSGNGFGDSFNSSIDKPYLDGISITRGSPKQHVWSYIIGVQENYLPDDLRYICPCNNASLMQVPSYVGSDYYCESGCPGMLDFFTIHFQDVLWDGQQCGLIETACCAPPNQPWFHKILDAPSNDDIEIRLCIDQDTSNENTLVSLYEIYTK